MAKLQFRQSGFLALVLLAFGLLWAQNVLSQTQPVGTVLTVSGQVTAESAKGETRFLKRRDSVFKGDTISTQPGARARFKLLDDSTYVLQESSIFTIEEYNYSGSEDGSEIADFYFSEGVLEFVSGYIGKQDETKFRIETEFAAIGLRGSGGIITTDSNSTQVFVTLGELTARSKDGDLFVLDNGQTTVIDDSGQASQQEGNQTGATQTMTTEGDDMNGQDESGQDSGSEDESENEEQEDSSDEEANDSDSEGSDDVAAEESEEVNEADESINAEEADAEDNNESADSGESGSANENAGVGDSGGQSDNSVVTDAAISAAEIYAELLPDSIEPTQDDLQQALNEAIESNPVLYAELVTVAIDLGLEPPDAAMTATEALGGASVSEEIITEIFFVATEGLADTAEVEQAILNADINAALVATPTDTDTVDVDAGDVNTAPSPSNTVVPPPNSASPAR